MRSEVDCSPLFFELCSKIYELVLTRLCIPTFVACKWNLFRTRLERTKVFNTGSIRNKLIFVIWLHAPGRAGLLCISLKSAAQWCEGIVPNTSANLQKKFTVRLTARQTLLFKYRKSYYRLNYRLIIPIKLFRIQGAQFSAGNRFERHHCAFASAFRDHWFFEEPSRFHGSSSTAYGRVTYHRPWGSPAEAWRRETEVRLM